MKAGQIGRSTYRRFSEGEKVTVEIPMNAAVAGWLSTEETVVSTIRWDTTKVITRVRNDRCSESGIRIGAMYPQMTQSDLKKKPLQATIL